MALKRPAFLVKVLELERHGFRLGRFRLCAFDMANPIGARWLGCCTHDHVSQVDALICPSATTGAINLTGYDLLRVHPQSSDEAPIESPFPIAEEHA